MSGRLHNQLHRVLLVAELLAPLRVGATLDELSRDASSLSGVPVCERTIRRDCKILEGLGIVEHVHGNGSHHIRGRWRWCDQSMRSMILKKMAETVAED